MQGNTYTLVYSYEALQSEDCISMLSSDVKNKKVGKIIIPNFLFRMVHKKLNGKRAIQMINMFEKSSKIQIVEFVMAYEQPYGFSYFTLFMEYLKRRKGLKNLFVRIPIYTQETIECIRHGYRVYIEGEPEDIVNNITNENYVEARSKVAFIDTCYLVKMLGSPYTGLNIMCENHIKKLILSCNLEELLNIEKKDIFKHLLYFLNEKEKYNIEFISSSAAYDKIYVCNDLTMLSEVFSRYDSLLTVYTYDMNLLYQCITLKIQTSSKSDTENYYNLDTPPLTANGTQEKDATDSILNDRSTDTAESISDNSDIEDEKKPETKESENNISINVENKKKRFYISADSIQYAYSNIAGKEYSNTQYFGKKRIKMFEVRDGWYLKLKNEDYLYKIVQIDRSKKKAILEKSSLT